MPWHMRACMPQSYWQACRHKCACPLQLCSHAFRHAQTRPPAHATHPLTFMHTHTHTHTHAHTHTYTHKHTNTHTAAHAQASTQPRNTHTCTHATSAEARNTKALSHLRAHVCVCCHPPPCAGRPSAASDLDDDLRRPSVPRLSFRTLRTPNASRVFSPFPPTSPHGSQAGMAPQSRCGAVMGRPPLTGPCLLPPACLCVSPMLSLPDAFACVPTMARHPPVRAMREHAHSLVARACCLGRLLRRTCTRACPVARRAVHPCPLVQRAPCANPPRTLPSCSFVRVATPRYARACTLLRRRATGMLVKPRHHECACPCDACRSQTQGGSHTLFHPSSTSGSCKVSGHARISFDLTSKVFC